MLLTVEGCVDSPQNGALVHRHAFQIEGWAFVEGLENRRVAAFVGDTLIGVTDLIFERSDVALAFGRPGMVASGFMIGCALPESLRSESPLDIRLAVLDAAGSRHDFADLQLHLSAYDYRFSGHGTALRDGSTTVLRRSDVYGSGPPSPLADARAVNLVRRYLSKHERLLDVGCGIGAYGLVLAPEGYDWTGCEVREDFCDAVAAQGLSVAQVTGNRLPFDDRAFDSALCIEVLEHIDDYANFIAEIRRVVARRAVFSVPNFEAIPIMATTYAIPWHMLESDHKSFFTRSSLAAALGNSFSRVEVFEYGALDSYRAQDALPVFNHLFAIADV